MKRSLLLLISVFMISGSCFAWGVLGHRIVGEIAQSYLNTNAKKNITAILGNETIAMGSNWPDFIKSDPAYSYLSLWHYINLPGGLSKSDFISRIENDTSTNAFTKILFLQKQLRNKLLDNKTQSEYLKLLVHMVGDIHQPLHVGRLEDRGGNSIKITWFGDNVNLHQVWDERLINFQQLSYTEYTKAINFATIKQRRTWQREPVSEWFYQSYQHAEKIYSDIQQDEKLSYNYNFKYIAVVNEQLLKGGVRLAGMLNDLYK